jgi:hypothetical protein
MSDFNVTRGVLSLGARDSTTGWCAKSYTDSTIEMIVRPKSSRQAYPSMFRLLTAYDATGYTDNEMFVGDHITHQGTVYEVQTVEWEWWGDNAVYAVCGLKQITPFSATRPDTSATWHTDAESVKTDPRERTLQWIYAYGTATRVGWNYIAQFAGVDYPFQLEFTSQGNEGVYVLGDVSSESEYTYDNNPYKFNESIPIHIYTVDTASVTGTLIAEEMEQELRYIAQAAENHLTSWRLLTGSKNERVDIGGLTLWHSLYTLKYTRENDDYVPTFPTVTYGPSAAPTGTFVFPNVTGFRLNDADSGDILSLPLSRIGNITQILGLADWILTLTCDLDVEHYDLTWKRPQTAASKTDHNNWQVFEDIKFNGKYSSAQTYQTLNLGHGATVPVRLVDFLVDNSQLTVTFRRYSATAGTAYTTWYGTS